MRRTIFRTAAASAALAALAGACEPHVSTVGQGPPNGHPLPHLAGFPKVDKVDILLVIDNSRSMADKQEVLALAMTDLIQGLANPPCVLPNGQPATEQPASVELPCVQGHRPHAPIDDIHIGVISTSLGGHGSDSCSEGFDASENDRAHLLDRKAPGSVETVATYQGFGFLAWDPKQKQVPPGESDEVALAEGLGEIVKGVGEVGCGYEAQLESIYRFLVDPAPHMEVSLVGGEAVPVGTDTVLLDQRARFLRPDSAVAVLLISDENDCSIIDGGYNFLAAQLHQPGTNNPFHLPRARQECAVDPNDACCSSCASETPTGCPPDPMCSEPLPPLEDHPNLRCFDQKRRFGLDFLQPIDRYVQGFTSTTVSDQNGNMVTNPLFADLDPNDGPAPFVRDPGLVYFAVITGVPWQDVARNPQDLSAGFKNHDEMLDASSGISTWDAIVGDPQSGTPPVDPLMHESIDPRSGTNPYTGEALATSATPLANSVNGHEYTPTQRDDLQYACIYPLLQPRDCSTGGISCDCNDVNDSPLCEANPNSGGTPTLQVRAKAYPGARQLHLARELGAQSIVASICPANITDSTQDDFAYREAIRSLVERMSPRLKGL